MRKARGRGWPKCWGRALGRLPGRRQVGEAGTLKGLGCPLITGTQDGQRVLDAAVTPVGICEPTDQTEACSLRETATREDFREEGPATTPEPSTEARRPYLPHLWSVGLWSLTRRQAQALGVAEGGSTAQMSHCGYLKGGVWSRPPWPGPPLRPCPGLPGAPPPG